LTPFDAGNTAAARHGIYSGRLLGPRAAEIRDALLALPHVTTLDVLLCEEIGATVAVLEAIDAELADRPSSAARRHLLDHRVRHSNLLVAHLREAGATPPTFEICATELSSSGRPWRTRGLHRTTYIRSWRVFRDDV
jgi:hypothetical protein